MGWRRAKFDQGQTWLFCNTRAGGTPNKASSLPNNELCWDDKQGDYK